LQTEQSKEMSIAVADKYVNINFKHRTNTFVQASSIKIQKQNQNS